MKSLDKQIDQLFSDLKSICGGVRNDYFGLVYLENEFELPREKAINQIAFGGNDYGIDGFHFDKETKNFYIYQFKYTNSVCVRKSTAKCAVKLKKSPFFKRLS